MKSFQPFGPEECEESRDEDSPMDFGPGVDLADGPEESVRAGISSTSNLILTSGNGTSE